MMEIMRVSFLNHPVLSSGGNVVNSGYSGNGGSSNRRKVELAPTGNSGNGGNSGT